MMNGSYGNGSGSVDAQVQNKSEEPQRGPLALNFQAVITCSTGHERRQQGTSRCER